MTTFRAPGCVRLTATYLRDSFEQSMQFHFQFPLAPQQVDLSNVEEAYSEWDSIGAPLGVPYRLFRTNRSQLATVRVESLDPTTPFTLIVNRNAESAFAGLNPEDALPSAVAPLITWLAFPGQARRFGRTYAACLCRDALDTLNTDRMSEVWVLSAPTLFEDLLNLEFVHAGASMVLVRRYVRGVVQDPMLVSTVRRARADFLPPGTQRRRLERALAGGPHSV